MKALIVLSALFALALACGGGQSEAPQPELPGAQPPAADPTPPPAAVRLTYPQSRREKVVDDYHGTKVEDPYRWLEDDNADEVKAWVEKQNQVTFGYLDKIPAREQLNKRLTKLWDYEKYGTPKRVADRYFFSKNDGLQNQSVLYWTTSLDADPKVLLDPNKLSKDGTVALRGYAISEDGKYIAYGLAAAGSDWNKWKIREIETGKDLAETLEWIKFSGASWTHDNKGFYYSRYPEPRKGDKLKGANFNQALYYHRIGTPQSKDKLIYRRPDHPKWGFGAQVSEDGRYLIVSVWKGTGEKNLVFYRDLKRRARRGRNGEALKELISDWKAEFSFIGNDGPVFWFKTDESAPRRRVIAIDTRKPTKRRWSELIPESKDTLTSVDVVGKRFFADYLVDASTRIRMYSFKGKSLGEVKLPGIGSASGFGGKKDYMETFYYYTSFNAPGSVYRYDIASGKSTLFKAPKVDFDPSRYVTEQVFYKSKDGTRVPMFISYKKGLKKNGKNPTLLYGYGGFNISLTPYFSVTNLVWMERGGIYAVPNLRGGGEYGREWHEAGIKNNKQNVFDDFIAAAEWLIANGYTSTPRLAISGGSNGGLLVGATMTQRPDLFGAAVPRVGVLDMLRFHKFTIGWAWIDDYGSSDEPKGFQYLYKYSPYHNLEQGTRYPSTLITTGDHDDRVVPAHSFKFAAALQQAHKGKNPVLIRIQTKAGHGAGKPTKMIIKESADVLAFLAHELGMSD
ncbi:MAG: prolyl oligopeptidase family serine peptidase [Deltaproteobacteria bacterium]|nr:prolyl oligopeptidase family serine peptidase [Deltaproteobacteria bacterium]